MDDRTYNSKWPNRFMDMAELVAGWSKDPSTKVGAVLTSGRKVIGLGYNGFPAGCNDSEGIYEDRPEKYRRVVHAEANAILNCNGLSSSDKVGLAIHCTLCPCSTCAGMIINFGIKEVFCPAPTQDLVDRWGPSFHSAVTMFNEADVKLWYLPR